MKYGAVRKFSHLFCECVWNYAILPEYICFKDFFALISTCRFSFMVYLAPVCDSLQNNRIKNRNMFLQAQGKETVQIQTAALLIPPVSKYKVSQNKSFNLLW